MSDVERVVPLPGPIEELRLTAVSDAQARAMLRRAVSGVELGAYDRDALNILVSTDTRVTTVVASLIRRAWAAGVEVGRAERLDEVPADVRHWAECLVDDVTLAVEGYTAD